MRTGDQAQAIRQARIVAYDFERALRDAEGANNGPISTPEQAPPMPVRAAAPTAPLIRPSCEKTFRDLYDLFLADASKERARTTQMIYDNLFAVIGGVWGADKPLRSINREACRDLLETLRWLPSNPTKRFPKLTIVEASRMAKTKGLTSILSPGSVNGYMNKLGSLLNYAVNEGWIERNPAKGLRVVDPVRRRDKRSPFSTDQLRLIFNAPLYRGCVDDEWHYAEPGQNRPRRGRFWVPLIALFSGMRLNEICQLDTDDIRSVEGVDCFSVSAGAFSAENDKRLKTASSERFIPVHPMLGEIGFMEFVAERRRSGDKKLFADLPMSTSGYFSDPFSKWFRRFLDRSGATQAKTCFHSFRHCFRDALRDARIDHDVALALGGWSSGSGKEGAETAEAYGRGFRVATLLEAMERVDYPNLDLRHLNPPPALSDAGEVAAGDDAA